MTHIRGHIQQLPQSCGTLMLKGVIDGQSYEIELPFVPPGFDVVKDLPVGFHPVTLDNKVLAVDIVIWDNHSQADKIVIEKLGDKIEKYHTPQGKGKLKELLKGGKVFNEDEEDVVRKTMNYFATKDFAKYYMRNGGDPNPDDAIRLILQKMGVINSFV